MLDYQRENLSVTNVGPLQSRCLAIKTQAMSVLNRSSEMEVEGAHARFKIKKLLKSLKRRQTRCANLSCDDHYHDVEFSGTYLKQ